MSRAVSGGFLPVSRLPKGSKSGGTADFDVRPETMFLGRAFLFFKIAFPRSDQGGFFNEYGKHLQNQDDRRDQRG